MARTTREFKFRLDASMDEELAKLARLDGISYAEVVRDACAAYIKDRSGDFLAAPPEPKRNLGPATYRGYKAALSTTDIDLLDDLMSKSQEVATRTRKLG
jgi:predicted DNA-binding protein